MTSKLSLIALSLALVLPACGEATDADADPSPAEPVDVAAIERDLPAPAETPEIAGEIDSACRAQLAEPFVGETLDLGTRTSLLDAVEPQAIVRFLEPDESIEGDDDNADRLNIRSDENDIITEVFCG